MRRTKRNAPFLVFMAVLSIVFAARAYDLSKDSIDYEIAGAHLDDQWQWTLTTSISTYLPNTMNINFAYINQYPEYIFSFESAFRYGLIKKYYPTNYATLKSLISQNRWYCAGAFWDACDVQIPSAEALIRQALYGTEYFMDEFGKRPADIYLPDCFGFGYALPTIARHCGLIGFSTQKYDLNGGWYPTPFPIGSWIGVDSSSVIAALKPGLYNNGMDIRTTDGNWLKSRTGGASGGIWATQDYIGTGDSGGGPTAANVSAMITRIRANATSTPKVYCLPSDQLYKDINAIPGAWAKLPTYNGELILRTHGTGCYTAWATMKLKNRRNEQMGMAAELACVMGNWMTGGTFAYPQDTITAGWHQFLACQFHDEVTGTSIPQVYAICQPMEDSAYNDLSYAFGLGNNIIANSAGQQLSTTVSTAGRVPLVLVNSLAMDRCDVVQAAVTFGSTTHAGVKVYGPDGVEVPAQIKATSGLYDTILFIAKVPSASYTVYEAAPVQTANPPDPNLTIHTSSTGDTLQNSNYRVVINAAGDVSSVYNKLISKELLSGASRLEERVDLGTASPAWEVTYAGVSSTPTYVTGTPTITVLEKGPARVSLQVVRTTGASTFTQIFQLAADPAGLHVDVDNAINWMTTGTLLKVGFPVTCSNANATWDLGIGTIQRPTMDTNRYEVPGHQWADMTSTDGSYGLSILNNCKYGWNKESVGKINLTLIHSPSGGGYSANPYQQDQSNVAFVGIHRFKYSFYGHSGNWTNGTVAQAACLNQPISAFQASSQSGATGMKQISFVRTGSPQVVVMAIKKAEKSNNYVIRVREANGSAITGATLTFPNATISKAFEMNGIEDTIPSASPISLTGNVLTFNLTKYQPRAFAVTLSAPTVAVLPQSGNYMGRLSANEVFTVELSGTKSVKALFKLPSGEKVHAISIADASGRVVRSIASANGRPMHSFVWDGMNGNARSVAAGLYIVTVETGHSHISARLPVIR